MLNVKHCDRIVKVDSRNSPSANIKKINKKINIKS